MISKNGINGLIKLGKTKKVVEITSTICVVNDCCNSNILKICDNHIRPMKIKIFTEIYFK